MSVYILSFPSLQNPSMVPQGCCPLRGFVTRTLSLILGSKLSSYSLSLCYLIVGTVSSFLRLLSLLICVWRRPRCVPIWRSPSSFAPELVSTLCCILANLRSSLLCCSCSWLITMVSSWMSSSFHASLLLFI